MADRLPFFSFRYSRLAVQVHCLIRGQPPLPLTQSCHFLYSLGTHSKYIRSYVFAMFPKLGHSLALWKPLFYNDSITFVN